MVDSKRIRAFQQPALLDVGEWSRWDLKILRLEIALPTEGPGESVEWGMGREVGDKSGEISRGKSVEPRWPYNGIGLYQSNA